MYHRDRSRMAHNRPIRPPTRSSSAAESGPVPKPAGVRSPPGDHRRPRGVPSRPCRTRRGRTTGGSGTALTETGVHARRCRTRHDRTTGGGSAAGARPGLGLRTDVTAAGGLPAGVTSPRGLPVAVAVRGDAGTGASCARGLRLDRDLSEAVRTRRRPSSVSVDGGWRPALEHRSM